MNLFTYDLKSVVRLFCQTLLSLDKAIFSICWGEMADHTTKQTSGTRKISNLMFLGCELHFSFGVVRTISDSLSVIRHSIILCKFETIV